MALTQATITFDVSDYASADFDARRTKVYATNNVPGGTVIDTVGNHIFLGSGTGTIGADGTGSISVPTPGTGSNPDSWQTTVHIDYPDRNAPSGRTVKSFGPFTITTSANLADLVAEMPVQPEYAAAILEEISGYTDHGNVSGAVTFNAPTGTHAFDATAPTTVTLDGYTNGQSVALVCYTGASDVTVTDAGDLELADGLAIGMLRSRDSWVTGGGGGEPATPDSTPPSAITDLVATGGEETISANWSDQTDAETTVKYKYRIWLSSGGASGAWTTTTTSGFGPLEIEAGVYTVEAYAFSNGGASAIDTATATVTAPVVTPRSMKLGRNPLYYYPLDDAPGTTNPVNLGSGGGTATKVGSVTFGATGIFGTTAAASFGGGYITMPLGANLNGLSAFTVELLVVRSGFGGGELINGGGAYDDSYDIGSGYYLLEGDMKANGAGDPDSPGRLFGMTYDGTTMRFYRDGTEIHSAAHSGAIASSATGAIGARGNGDNVWTGRIAEVVIYPTCLNGAAMLATAQAHGIV